MRHPRPFISVRIVLENEVSLKQVEILLGNDQNLEELLSRLKFHIKMLCLVKPCTEIYENIATFNSCKSFFYNI